MFEAVEDGDLNSVKKLIAKGCDVNIHKTAVNWPLILSAVPHPEILECLINNGAAVNVQEENKLYSPLITACRLNQIKSVKILLAHNADPHLTSFANLPALYYAIERDHNDIVQLILENEKDALFLRDFTWYCYEKSIDISSATNLIEQKINALEGERKRDEQH